MTTSEPLEKRGHVGNLKKIGCTLPIEKRTYDQVVLAFGRDIVTARRLSQNNRPAASYFANKARVIEDALERFVEDEKGKRGTYEVGYDVSHRFIYPGLPMEFAETIDASIVEIIDLIARCRHVAMTGSCCAGHPSKILKNPYLFCSQKDQKFSENTKGKHNFEEFIYTENLSPHLAIVLYRDEIGECIANMLSEIRAIAMPEGDVDNLEIIGYLNEIKGPQPSKLLTVILDGHLTIYFNGKNVEYGEFVHLYQEALCVFWRTVKNVFESVMGRGIPGPEAHQFTPKSNTDWDNDYKIYMAKVRAGYELPHYLYFNGNGDNTLLKPEII